MLEPINNFERRVNFESAVACDGEKVSSLDGTSIILQGES